MRKINKGEFVQTVSTGSDMNRGVYELLLGLKFGEQAVVLESDWKGKTGFAHSISNVRKVRRQFSIRRLLHEDGWLVTRIQVFGPLKA